MVSPHVSLEHLETVAVAFLDLCESIGRGLLGSERHAWRWILVGFESPHIEKALAKKTAAESGYYLTLMGALRVVFSPDQVKQTRLRRNKPVAVAELHDGSNKTINPPFEGVTIRRLTDSEAKERVNLIGKLAGDIGTICAELGLVRNRDRPAAANIVKLGKKLRRAALVFANGCKEKPQLPPGQSIEEIMDEMRQMNELMRAVQP